MPRTAESTAQGIVEVMTAQGFVRSEHPDNYSDPNTARSRRLHGQFYYRLSLLESQLISNTADSRWQMELHFAHIPESQRNDADFGQLEIGTKIENLIIALAQDATLLADDLSIRSAQPEWILTGDDAGFWDTTVFVEFQVPRRTD